MPNTHGPGTSPRMVKAIRIYVHEKQTSDDKEVLSLIDEIRGLVDASRLYRNPKPEIAVHSVPAHQPSHYQLPCLIDGATWEGLDEIRIFMQANREFAVSEALS